MFYFAGLWRLYLNTEMMSFELHVPVNLWSNLLSLISNQTDMFAKIKDIFKF